MNTYEYKVTDLQRDGNGIVVAATFQITASDGTASFTHNFHTAFRNNPVTPTDFNDITEAKVVEWIKKNVGEQSEQQADAELSAYKERNQVFNGLPAKW